MATIDLRKARGADTSELVRLYAEAAAEHRAASQEGDYKTANRQHDIVAGVYRELRRRGTESQRALLQLLAHPNLGVREWAAAHALEFDPDEGVRVLEELRSETGVVGLSAEYVLREWKSGKLRFP
jgi:hypothetical protein